MRKRLAALLMPFASLLAGCEGLFTGNEVARLPLSAQPDGGYAPVKVTLSPEMNPVSFNLHAGFTPDTTQAGRWNTYRATLTKDGNVVFTREFNVNYSGSAESAPAAGPAAIVMMIADIAAAGEHELAITPSKPVEVTLTDPQVAVRSKVERPPR